MIPPIFDLTGKKALVTGSSRGIGKSIAILLGQAGAQVFFHASGPSEKLDLTLEEAKRQGIFCDSATGNLSDEEETAALIRKTGDVDLLILNASMQKYVTIEEFDTQEFAQEFNTNVRSSFQLIQGYLPGMIAGRFGRIVTIGSVNQWKQSPRLSIYASTKSAQVNLMMNCARSYAKYGITANNIAPGVIATDRNKEALDDPQTAQNVMKLIPAGRFGSPDDCAGLVLLLCSDAGSYMTGCDIPVAGGMQL